MLVARNRLIVNACEVVPDFLRLAQDSRVDRPVKVPARGVPLTAQSKIVTAILLDKPVEGRGTATKRTTTLPFTCNLFGEGVIAETVGNRTRYLEFLAQNAKNKTNKARTERELARFRSLTAGMDTKEVLWLAAVDAKGQLFVSSSGVLQKATTAATDVLFTNGKHLADIVTSSGEVKVSQLSRLNLRKVDEVNLNTKVTESEVKQALSLTGMLLTIRGFHSAGRSADDVIAEWNMVAQPLLEAIPGQAFSSWDLPWAISTFSSLNISAADRARANYVAPYLPCALGIIASAASSAELDDVRLIHALDVGEWTKANDQYNVRINGKSLTIDASYTPMIDNALAMDRAAVSAVSREILEAAEIYGRVLGDGSLWTTVLWCEWLGITGLMGGLAINASE